MPKLKIVIEEMCIYTGPKTVEVSDAEYSKLCAAYGVYGIDWYFVSTNTIKYFDNEQWHYADHPFFRGEK